MPKETIYPPQPPCYREIASYLAMTRATETKRNNPVYREIASLPLAMTDETETKRNNRETICIPKPGSIIAPKQHIQTPTIALSSLVGGCYSWYCLSFQRHSFLLRRSLVLSFADQKKEHTRGKYNTQKVETCFDKIASYLAMTKEKETKRNNPET